jgi:cyclic pyranopterin phosphate synthase
VVIRGINDDEIADFGRWASEVPVDIRFIEFMPTHSSGWGRERLVPEAEIKERLGLSLTPFPRTDALAGPAQSFGIDGGRGRVSFISAVSHSFCSECNRLRITADGNIVGCLFGKSAVSLKDVLAQNPSEEKLIATLKGILASPGFRRTPGLISISSEQPPMRKIGG